MKSNEKIKTSIWIDVYNRVEYTSVNVMKQIIGHNVDSRIIFSVDRAVTTTLNAQIVSEVRNKVSMKTEDKVQDQISSNVCRPLQGELMS